jgi:membrane protein
MAVGISVGLAGQHFTEPTSEFRVDAQTNYRLSAMLSKRPDLPFLLSAASAALLVVTPSLQRSYRARARRIVPNARPFGESRSSEEPLRLELQRAQENDRGRHATQPLQIPRKGWYDILWRTYQEMQQDRLLSIAGGVSFFVLIAIFPAITAFVSAYYARSLKSSLGTGG